MQPTFGVSFGLPQPSHGYPINPFNSNPIYNPYGPALNGGGLNLGLVSVNPLLAVQVSKNDYGEKIVKPFVNLHVTPNEHVVNKLGQLFHEKKHYLLNKHEHYHHYNPHPFNDFHRPVNYLPFPPHRNPYYHINKPHSIYSPHYQNYGHFRGNPQSFPAETVHNNDDDEYYDDSEANSHTPDYYHYPGNFERSLNASGNNLNTYADRYTHSRSFTIPNNPTGANQQRHSFRFPEKRKKRDVSKTYSKEDNIQEVKTNDTDHLLKY